MLPDEESAKSLVFRAFWRRCLAVLWPEIRIVLPLFISAFFVGVVYVSTWGGQPEFWQQVFGPSVMAACGHGFTNPHLDDVPSLEDFLYLRADRFDCAAIPADVRLLPADTAGMTYDEIQAFHPLGQFPGWTQWQRFHHYLLWSVALMFSLFGVAWSSLAPLYGLLYGLTNALGYGIFRLGMGRAMAAIGGVLLITSPLHLEQLPQLRDYSKAPFFFLLILAAGWLLKRPRPLKQALPLAGLAGLAGGLGLGFRQDVAIAAALFCVLLAMFWPGPIKATWPRRAAVLGVFVGAFVLSGMPIIQVLARVNNSTHDTIIGFTRYCDQRLGVSAPLYDFGDPFMDEYVRAMIQGHAYRTSGRTEIFRHYSAPYDAAGKAYFREMALTFPADLLVRGYASVTRIADELQVSAANGAPRGITNQFVARLYQGRQAMLDALPAGGRYHVAAMLLLLATVNPRLGMATFAGILVLAGYPALRFSTRHAFHMEILALFAAAFLLYWAARAALAAWRCRRQVALRPFLAAAKVYAVRAVGVALAAVVVLALPLLAARWWQSGNVEALLSDYEAADRALLVPEMASGAGDRVHMRLPGLASAALARDAGLGLPMHTEVLVLAFSPGEDPVDINFVFNASDPLFEFGRTMTVPGGTEGPVHLYYPVYFGQGAAFDGFSLPAASRPRFQAAYRLTDLSDMRILLNAVLYPGWETLPLYQRFSR